jgi:hypothetical protein
MAKWQNDIVLDQALSYVMNNVTQMAVCNAQPANLSEATTTYKLALKTGLTSGSFTGPADDTSGRKITTVQQAGVTVDTGGTATHVALCSASALLLVTTCTSQVLTGGNTVTIPAFKFTFPDVA